MVSYFVASKKHRAESKWITVNSVGGGVVETWPEALALAYDKCDAQNNDVSKILILWTC